MDEPVTDIVFVSSKVNCPKGYQIVSTIPDCDVKKPLYSRNHDHAQCLFLFLQIEKCPCGHEAQMWEKLLGGQSGERYLCFSKEEKVYCNSTVYTFDRKCIHVLRIELLQLVCILLCFEHKLRCM